MWGGLGLSDPQMHAAWGQSRVRPPDVGRFGAERPPNACSVGAGQGLCRSMQIYADLQVYADLSHSMQMIWGRETPPKEQGETPPPYGAIWG